MMRNERLARPADAPRTAADLTRGQKDEIRRYVSAAVSGDDRARRIAEYADKYDAPLSVIQTLTARRTKWERQGNARETPTKTQKITPVAHGKPDAVTTLRADIGRRIENIDELSRLTREVIVADLCNILEEEDERPNVDWHVTDIARYHNVTVAVVERLARENISRWSSTVAKIRERAGEAINLEQPTNPDIPKDAKMPAGLQRIGEAAKKIIRDYVAEATDPEEKKRRRKEMAEKHGISIAQVGAITAWTKIWADRDTSGSAVVIGGSKRTDTVSTALDDVLSERGAIATKPEIAKIQAAPGETPKNTLPAPTVSNLRTDTAALVENIAELDASKQMAIARDMRYILADADELHYVDEHIAAIAYLHGVTGTVVELIAGRNIPGAKAKIVAARERARQAMDFERPKHMPTLAGSPTSEGLRLLDEAAKKIIRDYVAEATDPEEKKRRRKEMAEKHGISIAQVGAITAWTKIWADRDGTADTAMSQFQTDASLEHLPTWSLSLAEEGAESDSTHAPQSVPVASPVASPGHVPGTRNSDRGEGLGAVIDYDTPIKNAWRATIAKYIARETDPKKRPNMRVLCLPGVECLEIPIYLEMGFRPENIVGAEAGIVGTKSDPKLIARFEENARRYGIRTHIGRLEEAGWAGERLFDVVSLDFVGPFSENAYHLFKRLPLADKTVIITNFQGRRETEAAKEIFFQSQALSVVGSRKIGGTEFSHNATGKLSDIRDGHHVRDALFSARISKGVWPDGENVAVDDTGYVRAPVRWKDLYDMLHRVMSTQRLSCMNREFSGIPPWFTPQGIATIMTAHFRNYIFAYASQLFPERRRLENMDKVFEFMEQVVAFGFSRGLVITKAARYSYKNGRTPMFTDCFTIDRIEPEAFSPMKHSIRFILTVLDEFLENLPRIARDPKSVKFRFGLETIRGDDEFSIYADGKRVGAIEMRTLFRDARYYLEHIASRSVEYGEHNRDSREEIKAESR